MEELLAELSDDRRAGLTDRQWPGPPKEGAGKRYRTDGQRDLDRILYCSALQRLAYVTQVTAPESGHTFHNRLSHSLKVAQVGRRNAERLQALAEDGTITGAAARLVEAVDPDSVEASCLAHDLGHPPFGHIAEVVLHEEAKLHLSDGFEGNAQSFRIVTRLAVRSEQPGLNLTRRVLDGLLKYPWSYRSPDPRGIRDRKWGYYPADPDAPDSDVGDSAAFDFVRANSPQPKGDELAERCLEAWLTEWADDLTYAVHDVDDFYRAGLIPLDRLNGEDPAELKRLTRLLEDARDANPAAFPSYEVDELVGTVQEILALKGPSESYENTAAARAEMREFGSQLITHYLEAFMLEHTTPGKVKLRIDDAARLQVEALRMLVHVYVIRRPGLAVVQHGQGRVIRDLFSAYYEASPEGKAGDRRLFPPGAKERLDDTDDTEAERARVVVDLVSGLTESSAIQLHRRLAGGWTAPTLDATAQMG